MADRRKFIKLSALTAGLFTLKPIRAASLLENPAKKPFNGPVVISTWAFGKRANDVAWEVLEQGKSALEAVVEGVKTAESDPNERSVGFGGRPDRDGRVTLDACLMDSNGNIGSVACLEHIKNPIEIAKLVMEKTPHVMLVGDGALQFALEQGFKKENLLTKESEKEWKEWLKTGNYKPKINIENHDTIATLAIDHAGNLSGACTTSGMAYKMHGRVGDSPIIGAGLFVDNEIGAAAATGQGEEIIRVAGSHLVVELMRQGLPPQEACREAVIRTLKKKSPDRIMDIQVGFIALNKAGEFGAYALQKGFNYAVKSNQQSDLLDSDFYMG